MGGFGGQSQTPSFYETYLLTPWKRPTQAHPKEKGTSTGWFGDHPPPPSPQPHKPIRPGSFPSPNRRGRPQDSLVGDSTHANCSPLTHQACRTSPSGSAAPPPKKRASKALLVVLALVRLGVIVLRLLLALVLIPPTLLLPLLSTTIKTTTSTSHSYRLVIPTDWWPDHAATRFN
jgi:hypothetical protein